MDTDSQDKQHTGTSGDAGVNGVKNSSGPAQAEGSPGSGYLDVRSVMTSVEAVVAGVGNIPEGLQVPRLGELPVEVQHITTEMVPLSLLITRLAEYSRAGLQDHIAELAAKPLPPALANGNVNGANGGPSNSAPQEDTSPESLEKKAKLLNFIQDLHSRWVKMLVIIEWSRNADEVSTLIDLRTHLANKLELYNTVFWDLVNVKREMAFARVPSPDIKTALEVLSTGTAHWMPDFGYLPKPPLTTKEKIEWLEEMNLQLHMRMQLHEYERIPAPFKDHKIDDGRITFRVEGEFEVDLTIADEDFEKQFWFLDYRPLYTPACSEMSAIARNFIEAKVNTILATDGLNGCYNYLHELTLTTKISEVARQASELASMGRWKDTLRIERLNRALSIQYWLNCPHSQGKQSWIMLGVHSGGKGPDGIEDTPSYLMLRWFRDSKEVMDFDIPFDVNNICTEDLLMAVISKHAEHILDSIYETLCTKPRFAPNTAFLSVIASKEDPQDSFLTVELFGAERLVVGIAPRSGTILFYEPKSPLMDEAKRRLNLLRNPVEEGPGALEQVRWFYTLDHMKPQFSDGDWEFVRQSPASTDEVKNLVYSDAPPTREKFHATWMRKASWSPQYFVMFSMSLGGDQWWLVEVSPHAHGLPGSRINSFAALPISPNELVSPDTLYKKLDEFATGIMAEINDLRAMHSQRTMHSVQKSGPHDSTKPKFEINLPVIMARVDQMLPRGGAARAPGRTPWAKEFVRIEYKGKTTVPPCEYEEMTVGTGPLQRQVVVADRTLIVAKLAVLNPARFHFLKRTLERDTVYDPRTGQFTLTFRTRIGQGCYSLLVARIQALDRLVDFVDALHRAGKHVTPENMSLRQVSFFYGRSTNSEPAQPAQRLWTVRLGIANKNGVNVVLEKGNPHLRVIDYLRSAVNSSRFKTLPAWLVLTLPLYQGLDRLQDAWEPTDLTSPHGECYIFHKSLDWVTLRFVLPGAKGRRLQLDIKPREKDGELVWHIFRSAQDASKTNENDEFNKVLLSKVWSARDKPFKGLTTGAVAHWEHGIEALLALISDTLLPLINTPPPAQAQLPSPHQQHQQPQAQQQPQYPQQQQQQPVPKQQHQQPPSQIRGQPPQPQPGQPRGGQHQQPFQLQQPPPIRNPAGARAAGRPASVQQQMQARLAQQQQQQHQRGGGGPGGGQGMGTSNAPLVVPD